MASYMGTSGDDVLHGTEGNDGFNGGAGADEMHGAGGNDGFYGGGGNDLIFGDAGDDTLIGQGGDDELHGGTGDDTLIGGVGNDLLIGGEGTNTIDGDGGNDHLVKTVGAGMDQFDGGTGIDIVTLVLTSAQLTPAIDAELEALNDWIEASIAAAGGDPNALAGQTDGAAKTFVELGVTLSNVEQVMVEVDGTTQSLTDYLGAAGGSGGGSGPVVPDGFDYAFTGTSGNDQLTGTADADYITADAGDDHVAAGAGADEVFGGDGKDRLYGENDADVLHGEAGDDLLVGGHGNDTLLGGDGNDGFYGGGDHDSIFGEAGDDTMFGDAGDDMLDGGEGNNRAFGGSGNDELHHAFGNSNELVGGTGVDTAVLKLSLADLSDAVKTDLADLKDWLDAKLASVGGGVQQLAGQTGEAPLTLNALGVSLAEIEQVRVFVDGTEVDLEDLVNAAPVADASVTVGTDEDVALQGQVDASDADGDVLSYVASTLPGHGNVSVDASTGAYVYTPGPHFSGTDSFEVTITDPSGATVTQVVNVDVESVADQALLAVSDASVVLDGRAPIYGTSGSDTLVGDGVAVVAMPLSIDAQLMDADGSETLSVTIRGLPFGATLSAGTVNADGSVSLQPAELAGLEVTNYGTQSFSLEIEAVTVEQANGSVATVIQTLDVDVDATTVYDNVIFGLDGNDTISGGLGNDTLVGGDGNDEVDGGSGNDVIVGGEGRNTYNGGDGFDILDMSASGKNVRVDLERGYARGEGRDAVVEIEGVIGSGRNDRLWGDDADNVFWDGAGNDRVDGRDGDDRVVVGAGNDRYSGGAGVDTIDFSEATNGVDVDLDFGRATGMGNDRLDGFESVVGSGFDDTINGTVASETFTGGVGDDTFVWDYSDLSMSASDTITDFDASSDVLDFSALYYTGWFAPADNDRVWLNEVTGGTMVSVDMSYLDGATDVVFLEGVTGLTGTDWFTF